MHDKGESASQIAALGKHPATARQLMPVVYDELRRLALRKMAAERPNHTLQPTAVVHEAFLRLAGGVPIDDLSRSHFVALAAGVIRRILIDHARQRLASKRGGALLRTQIEIDVIEAGQPNQLDVLALEEVLQELAILNERQARVVELRFFGGLGVAETAAVLDLSERTVKEDWRIARAWLATKLR